MIDATTSSVQSSLLSSEAFGPSLACDRPLAPPQCFLISRHLTCRPSKESQIENRQQPPSGRNANSRGGHELRPSSGQRILGRRDDGASFQVNTDLGLTACFHLDGSVQSGYLGDQPARQQSKAHEGLLSGKEKPREKRIEELQVQTIGLRISYEVPGIIRKRQ